MFPRYEGDSASFHVFISPVNFVFCRVSVHTDAFVSSVGLFENFLIIYKTTVYMKKIHLLSKYAPIFPSDSCLTFCSSLDVLN